MSKNQGKSKTAKFPGGQASIPTESKLEMIGRLSDEKEVDEAETHRKLNAIDTQAGVELPKTEEYVKAVVTYLAEQTAYVSAQNLQARHMNARENVLMASTVLSREYPKHDIDGVPSNVGLSLQAAGNLMAKELSLLDGGY